MRNIITLMLSTFLVCSMAYADSAPPNSGISLYEQPDAKSKLVGTIGPGQALIPIFNQGNWTKVADPTNGNVGWVSADMLKQLGYPKIYMQTYSAKDGDNNASVGYQVVQSANASPANNQQIQQILADLQTQQDAMQRAFNQLVNQSISNFNEFAKQLQQQESHLVVQPVIIVPEKNQANAAAANNTTAAN